jgi:hypothetical protein
MDFKALLSAEVDTDTSNSSYKYHFIEILVGLIENVFAKGIEHGRGDGLRMLA